MAKISKYKYLPITVPAFGKNRIIRDIHKYTEHDLMAKYRNHDINISERKTEGFDVSIINLDTGIALEKWHYHQFKGDTLLEITKKCIETILLANPSVK